jgi:hypothetical protein
MKMKKKRRARGCGEVGPSAPTKVRDAVGEYILLFSITHRRLPCCCWQTYEKHYQHALKKNTNATPFESSFVGPCNNIRLALQFGFVL